MSPQPAAGGGAATVGGRRPAEHGVVSLEWVLALPLLVLAVVGLLEVAGVLRDVLLVHDAARAGARAAATSTGSASVEAAVGDGLDAVEPTVTVSPTDRTAGDLVEVRVSLDREVGPVTHTISARAVARVEPVVAPGARGPGP